MSVGFMTGGSHVMSGCDVLSGRGIVTCLVGAFVCDGGAGEVGLGASQASRERGAVLGSAAARVVLVEVVSERVPATADADHHVGSKDLEKTVRLEFLMLSSSLKRYQ